MNKREVVIAAVKNREIPYVPWQISLTFDARELLARHCGSDRGVEELLDNHFLMLGDCYGFFEPAGPDRVRDYFGVIWDRSMDKDIGMVAGQVLPEPRLGDYEFPDPVGEVFFAGIEERIAETPERFRVFNLGFSLFERAWTLRGLESLLMDFYLNPDFVRELLRQIADYTIAQMRKAVKYDIDCIHFGDDWGQQHGLIMGYPLWREFIYPELQRMYAVGRESGKLVSIHSCGDVDELFDDLVAAGLNIFNPFQPEVMDTGALMRQYRGRLCFYGGLSTQQVLPYGTPEEVAEAARRLLAAGRDGGLIFAPAHAVEGDVPLANLLAMMEVLKSQKGYCADA